MIMVVDVDLNMNEHLHVCKDMNVAVCAAPLQVVITDKDVVVPLIQENIQLNGLCDTPTAHCSGTAEVRRCGVQQGDGVLCGII